MALYRNVHVCYWREMENFKPDEKYFYLYLMTNEATTQCGIYQLTKTRMSFETGMSAEKVDTLLQRFIQAGKIRYNEDQHELMVVNWKKHNWPTSHTVATCVARELANVKTEDFRAAYLQYQPKHVDVTIDHGDTIDSVSRDHGGIKEQEQEQEEEQEEKEDARVEYAPHVRMSEAEHTKLITAYGESAIREKIDELSDYIGSKGKRYKSHYSTIRAWLRRAGVKPRDSPKRCPNGHEYIGSLCRECGWSE